MEKNITRLLNKLAGETPFILTVTKTFPWDERSVDLKFTIDLVDAILKDDLELDMRFLVKPLKSKDILDKAHFSRIFFMFDFQEDLRNILHDKYKLHGFDIERHDGSINYDFKIL